VNSYQAVDPFSEGERNRARLEKIPVRALRDLAQVPGSLVLDLRWAEMSGATPLNDMVSILTLAVLQQPEAVLEFGTFWGSTTVNLAMNLPSAVIHTIDLPPDRSEAEAAIKNRPVDDKNLIRSRELGRAFCGTEFESSIVQHTGDTAT
jgi:predicted O-methyltransferase YrrM